MDRNAGARGGSAVAEKRAADIDVRATAGNAFAAPAITVNVYDIGATGWRRQVMWATDRPALVWRALQQHVIEALMPHVDGAGMPVFALEKLYDRGEAPGCE